MTHLDEYLRLDESVFSISKKPDSECHEIASDYARPHGLWLICRCGDQRNSNWGRLDQCVVILISEHQGYTSNSTRTRVFNSAIRDFDQGCVEINRLHGPIRMFRYAIPTDIVLAVFTGAMSLPKRMG